MNEPAHSAPRTDDDSDPAGDALVRAFEDCSLEPARFGHREHLYVAFRYLRAMPFEDAAPRFVRGIRRYAAAHGAHDKFHATVTWAWLAVVAELLARADAPPTFEALLAAHPELLGRGAASVLARYYPPDVLDSPLARATFVLPPPR